MTSHLITNLYVSCGHIGGAGYEKCNHSRECSEENRFESHVELKLGECRKCEGDKMLPIHFRHLSDIQSLERYWTTRHLLKDKSTHGPFKISTKGVTDLAEALPWREVWQNNIVRLISEGKNGATTVYMNGLVVPIHELDDRVEDFVEEVRRKALNDAV
ncbi:hypothetical protein O9K51_11152 [Purpureocillium lavendulum]|uniref:Uncharacterized protein n=1 Tax=Purpureocillium lavendulum TaxID=1247861 RepID=A0AB34FAJ9_9HYPO|nr:hypothetical protein O9K51_11152 [Purpureocillium lavendulum]